MTSAKNPNSLVALFEQQVSRTPDRIALRCGSEALTFVALEARVNEIALYLAEWGIQVGDRVAVALPHSVNLVASYLAIVKAGATFVGLESRWPQLRKRQIVADSGSVATLTSGMGAAEIAGGSGAVIFVDDEVISTRYRPSAERDSSRSAQGHAIVYTSGTTGTPNGVAVPTASVSSRLKWLWSVHAFGPTDATLFHTSCATISFPMNCLGAMLHGGTTVVARDPLDVAETTRTAIDASVSCMSASPGYWEAMLDQMELRQISWPSLRLARTGGEQLRPEFVARWYRVFPSVPLLNVYGATECSTAAVYDTRAFNPSADARVPVGRAVPGVEVYVLDSALRPVPKRGEGEVFIGGASLADGYFERPVLTAEKFVAHPFARGGGDRLFRTGDLGRWRDDGCLEIVGRRDEQVNVRGFRVELGEIEAELRRTAGIREAAIIPYAEAAGSRDFVAHIELDPAASIGVASVRASLTTRLPGHMVPARVVAHERLPRTASGKIDKAQLRGLDASLTPRTSVAPRTRTEILLCAVWRSVLSNDSVGVDDNFFDLGGHSLAAMQIVSRISTSLDRDIVVTTVFDNPTVRLLAKAVDAAT